MQNLYHMLFCTVFYTMTLFIQTYSELFTSLAHMERGLEAEKNMSYKMKEYIKKEKERLKVLESVASLLESHSSQALEDPNIFLGNPINAFLFVKKFTLDWNKSVEDAINGNPNRNDFNLAADELRPSLPDSEDLEGAAKAILRLQDMYDIPAKDLASGNIMGVKTSAMPADACFEVGKIAYEEEDYFNAFRWFDVANALLKIEANKTTDAVEVLDYFAWSAHKLGNNKLALTLTEELLTIDPDHVRAANNIGDYKDLIARGENSEKLTTTSEYMPKPLAARDNSPEFRSYKRLCKGENVKPSENVHQLVCRYRHNNDSRLLLSPIKEEEVFKKAGMVLFHEIFRDGEMEIIKALATPMLKRATVHNSVTGKLEHAQYRITKTAWLSSDDHIVVDRVQHIIKAVTGLDLKSADDLQVANYGIGGHYDPHYDFSIQKPTSEVEIQSGNRIATFLLYMTDVEAGGATVFPRIDVRVLPRKGMAVFWYNLKRSGEGIWETRHAACPVLVGTKWVSNKWIREVGQEFRRPCGLTKDQ